MVLTGGRVVNTATNLVTSHNLETGEVAVQKLEKKSEWGKNYIELWNLSECQSLCLLAPTGALIVMMRYIPPPPYPASLPNFFHYIPYMCYIFEKPLVQGP